MNSPNDNEIFDLLLPETAMELAVENATPLVHQLRRAVIGQHGREIGDILARPDWDLVRQAKTLYAGRDKTNGANWFCRVFIKWKVYPDSVPYDSSALIKMVDQLCASNMSWDRSHDPLGRLARHWQEMSLEAGIVYTPYMPLVVSETTPDNFRSSPRLRAHWNLDHELY